MSGKQTRALNETLAVARPGSAVTPLSQTTLPYDLRSTTYDNNADRMTVSKHRPLATGTLHRN